MTLAYTKRLVSIVILFAAALFGTVGANAVTPCAVPTTAGFWATTLDYPGQSWNSGPSSVAVADFNNDGKADAAVAVSYDSFVSENKVFIYLGNATNGLSYLGTVQTILNPTDIVVTEFNNDGKLDLIVSSFSQIQTLVGNGNGGFAQVITYSITSRNIAVGDFNNDTKADIAVASPTTVPGRVSVFFGFGTGTYAAPFDTPTGDNPHDIKALDVNGDTKLDLVTVNSANGVSVLLNNGSGSFSFPTHFATATGLVNPTLAVGDFNNDTKLDLAVPNGPFGDVPYTAPTMAVLLGNGTGGFGAASVYGLGVNFSEMVAGDFTGDGNVDLAGLNNIQVGPGAFPDPGTVMLLSGSAGGSFIHVDSTGVGYSAGALAAGDFNNDGKLDLVATNGIKGLNTYPDLSSLLGRCNARHIQTDFDGDGLADFAVWRPSTGEWRIFQSFTNTFRIQQWGLGSLGDKPVPGDYDGDGKSDLAVFRPNDGTWYIQNSSDSSFRATPWGTSGDRPVPGDYDGDLKTDLAVFRPSTGAWYVLRSSDQTVVGLGWGLSTDKTVQGDYDGDGKTDVAVWRPSNGFWYVLNSADSSFSYVNWGTNGDVPVPGDYNGDSRSDPTAYRPSLNRWFLYRPPAIGQYIDRTIGPSADTPAPADYDGDGLTDYAIWRPSLGNFTWIRSYTGARVTSPGIGASGDIPVSTPYAPE